MAGGSAAERVGRAPETREFLFKVLVVGELGVGKSSVVQRYVYQLFSEDYRATIGVDFALKEIAWDLHTRVRLQFWDVAGQERFGNMTHVFYKEAAGAFVVFDMSDNDTFREVLKWKSDLDSKAQLPDGSPIPVVLLANKCDQKNHSSQSPAQLDHFCRENGFVTWFETSAKDNINIEEAAHFLVGTILANRSICTREEQEDVIRLHQDAPPAKGKSQCC
ncbi:ras-related protein Rab-32 [Tamandua tetradactyla]|uniref:ras-related protein Rab-32 n=1 Tax=Tamandua tetradactyla TaxID=48850 RepID=UPI00405447BB